MVDILAHNVGFAGQIETCSVSMQRLSTRRLKLARTPLNRLLAGVVQRRELHIQSRQLRVIVEAPEPVGDAGCRKMSAVLDNLLSTPSTSVPDHGEIRRLVGRDGPNWRFGMHRPGPGSPRKTAERIFDPVCPGQRQSPAPRQGSGVGLSIVRELARHGGGLSGAAGSGRPFCGNSR